MNDEKKQKSYKSEKQRVDPSVIHAEIAKMHPPYTLSAEIWAKTDSEKRALKQAKKEHKAELHKHGLNPKKIMNATAQAIHDLKQKMKKLENNK